MATASRDQADSLPPHEFGTASNLNVVFRHLFIFPQLDRESRVLDSTIMAGTIQNHSLCGTSVAPEPGVTCGAVALACVDCGRPAGCEQHALLCQNCSKPVCGYHEHRCARAAHVA